jgi:hypothetical protein
VSYSASVVKIHNATNSIQRFWIKNLWYIRPTICKHYKILGTVFSKRFETVHVCM